MNRNRQEKGITLIALVVTIIVLIILAAVTISYVFDQNLIKKAVEVNEISTIKAIQERLELVKGNMYIDNEGKSSIEKYFDCLTNKELEPYELTTKNILTDTLGEIVVNGKYNYLVKFDNNINIEYEGKVGEVNREEQVVEIQLTAEEMQSQLPINLSAQVLTDGENAKSGSWTLAKVSEEKEENVTTGVIKEPESINLEINEVGTYNLHVITTDIYGREKETVRTAIQIQEVYHKHEGNSAKGGKCYKTPVYKKATGKKVCGTYQMTLNAALGDGTSHRKCSNCGAKTYQEGNNNPGNHIVSYTYNTTTVDYYKLSCGKNEKTLEGYKITY